MRRRSLPVRACRRSGRLSPAGDEPSNRPRVPLFRTPTGLAVGLALKELRYDAADASTRPVLLGPPLLTFGMRTRRCAVRKVAERAAGRLFAPAGWRRRRCRRA